MATKVYISADGHEDLPLLADSQVVWEQKKGVGPFQTILYTQPNLKKRVEDMSRGLVTLNMIPDMAGGEGTANKLKVEKLYILDFPASYHPKYFAFVLADCRWMWEYYHIVTRYNMRRRIGFKRVEAPNEELKAVKDDLWFKKFSLQDKANGVKWTAQTALEDLAGQLCDYEFEHDVYDAPKKRRFHLDRELTNLMSEYPLDDMEIDDNGQSAIARMMQRLPMVNMYLRHDGDIQFYHALAGGDQEMVEKLGPEVFGTGHIDWVSKFNVRPSKVHILFTKEIEVRFDSQDEPHETVGTSGSDVVGKLAPSEKANCHMLENVLPVPDYKLKVDLNLEPHLPAEQGETTAILPSGSWISFHTALNAWANTENLDLEGVNNDAAKGIWPFLPKQQVINSDGLPELARDADDNPIGTALDFPFIRKAMIPWVDMFSGIVAASERFPSALHSARLLSIPVHWRRTYRIPNDWIDGALTGGVKAYRVGIVDQETGTRSPSMVYANYTIANTMRNMFKGADVLGNDDFGKSRGNAPSIYWTLWGYPGDLTTYETGEDAESFIIHPDYAYTMGIIDSRTKAAPATLEIVDEDQGIVRVDWKVDPLKLMDQIIPGHVAGQEGVLPENIRDRIKDEADHDIGQDVKTWAARGGVPRGWNWLDAEKQRITRMSHENRMATILTMIPAAPNDLRQLHKVTVEPKDIEEMLPEAARTGLKNAKGPEMYVRVGQNITTARYAWLDTAHHAQIARNNFGIEQPMAKKKNTNQDDTLPDRDEIEYEFKDGSLINQSNLGNEEFIFAGAGDGGLGAFNEALRGPAVDEVARAVAAKIYGGFTDKLSGSVDGVVNSEVTVDGYIGSVAHMADPRGAVYTSLSFTEPIPSIDIFSILDDSTRNLIMRIPT